MTDGLRFATALRRRLAFVLVLATTVAAVQPAEASVMTVTVRSTDEGLPIEIVLKYDVRRAAFHHGESAYGGGAGSPVLFASITTDGVAKRVRQFTSSLVDIQFYVDDVIPDTRHYLTYAAESRVPTATGFRDFSLWIGFLTGGGSALPLSLSENVAIDSFPSGEYEYSDAEFRFSTCVADGDHCRVTRDIGGLFPVESLHVVPLPPALPLLLGGLGGLALIRRRQATPSGGHT